MNRACRIALSFALGTAPACFIEREPPIEYPQANPASSSPTSAPVAATATVLEGDTSLDPGALAAGVSAVNGALAGCFSSPGQVELTVRLDTDGTPQEVQGASNDPACLMAALRQAPLPRPSLPTVFRAVLWVEAGAGGGTTGQPAGGGGAAAATRHDVFLVTIGAVRVQGTHPDGTPWDTGTGAPPDLFVKLLRNDEEVLRTAAISDSSSPTFDADAGRSLRLGPADQLVFEVYDDDPGGPPELLTRFQVPAPGQAELDRGAWEIGPLAPMDLLTIRLAPPRSLVGTGIRWEKRRGVLEVLEVAPDSPAALAGVVVGDRILTVEGQRVRGLSVEGLEALFRGEVGTTLRLELEHGGRTPADRRELTLERATVFY